MPSAASACCIAGVAAEARDLDVEAVLLEDAGLDADVGRHEGELRRGWALPTRNLVSAAPAGAAGQHQARTAASGEATGAIFRMSSRLSLWLRLAAFDLALDRLAWSWRPILAVFRSRRVALSSSDMLPRTTTP